LGCWLVTVPVELSQTPAVERCSQSSRIKVLPSTEQGSLQNAPPGVCAAGCDCDVAGGV